MFTDQAVTPSRHIVPIDDSGNEIPTRQAVVEIASTRASSEIQSAMVVAKRFPRDETRSLAKIMQACKRRILAEQSQYAFPRGGETVEGPSIRLAEVLAQSWGNIDFGVIELEQRNGESSMLAYAWDLETNTKSSKIFQVKHQRHTRREVKSLSDPRDIYEMTANQGARRLRSCILAIIPGDVVDAAIEECDKTMAGNNAEPLIDRIRKMLPAFEEIGVNQSMIEDRLGHRLDVTTETELARMRKIYRSIKDNMASVESFFPSKQKAAAEPSTLSERMNRTETPTDAPAAQERSIDASSTQDESSEPDVSSVVDAEPPPKDEPLQAAEFTDYQSFYDAMVQLAMVKGVSEASVGKMIGQAVAVGKGMKGKESKIEISTLRQWYQDFQNGKGFFKVKES